MDKISAERAVHRLGDCSDVFYQEGSLGEAFLNMVVGDAGSSRYR